MTLDKISEELKEISSRIPVSFKRNVVREVDVSPTMKFVIEKALADPDFPEDKKQALLNLRATGDLDRKEFKEDPAIVKKIDNFIEREINKKIKSGLLPHRSKLKDLPDLKALYEKIHSQKN